MANFFPRWTNWIPLKVIVCVIVTVCGLTGATWYYATPKYTKIGYQPIQPVPFPHDIHVTQLGMDCRYCHSFVEVAAQSNVPNTATCMNCHAQVAKDNPKLQPVQESWK
ncbi:MAG TPA: cytochrome c3 family protein, partial [Candidatus Udaeobacter sp.]